MVVVITGVGVVPDSRRPNQYIEKRHLMEIANYSRLDFKRTIRNVQVMMAGGSRVTSSYNSIFYVSEAAY